MRPFLTFCAPNYHRLDRAVLTVLVKLESFTIGICGGWEEINLRGTGILWLNYWYPT
jgi:hypothetical protein